MRKIFNRQTWKKFIITFITVSSLNFRLLNTSYVTSNAVNSNQCAVVFSPTAKRKLNRWHIHDSRETAMIGLWKHKKIGLKRWHEKFKERNNTASICKYQSSVLDSTTYPSYLSTKEFRLYLESALIRLKLEQGKLTKVLEILEQEMEVLEKSTEQYISYTEKQINKLKTDYSRNNYFNIPDESLLTTKSKMKFMLEDLKCQALEITAEKWLAKNNNVKNYGDYSKKEIKKIIFDIQNFESEIKDALENKIVEKDYSFGGKLNRRYERVRDLVIQPYYSNPRNAWISEKYLSIVPELDTKMSLLVKRIDEDLIINHDLLANWTKEGIEEHASFKSYKFLPKTDFDLTSAILSRCIKQYMYSSKVVKENELPVTLLADCHHSEGLTTIKRDYNNPSLLEATSGIVLFGKVSEPNYWSNKTQPGFYLQKYLENPTTLNLKEFETRAKAQTLQEFPYDIPLNEGPIQTLPIKKMDTNLKDKRL